MLPKAVGNFRAKFLELTVHGGYTLSHDPDLGTRVFREDLNPAEALFETVRSLIRGVEPTIHDVEPLIHPVEPGRDDLHEFLIFTLRHPHSPSSVVSLHATPTLPSHTR